MLRTRISFPVRVAYSAQESSRTEILHMQSAHLVNGWEMSGQYILIIKTVLYTAQDSLPRNNLSPTAISLKI